MADGDTAKPRFSGVGVRVLTALGFVALCILPFYIGGWVWAVLVALLASRMMYEWVRMSDPEGGTVALAIGVAGLVVALLYAVQGLGLWALAAIIVVAVVAAFERSRRGGTWWSALGLPYIIAPAVVIVLLRGSEVGFDTRGFTQLVFVILVVVAADAGAYFGGSQFGGPKLAPTLSPNKTWSGAFSGLALAVVVAIIAGLFMGLPWWLAATLAVPLVALSVGGDLLESSFKRKLGVKDTGTVLPGHGGLLDRLDSLMAAVVGGALLFALIGSAWPVT